MNSAVNFIFESGVSLAFLSLIYILFLRKETFFRLNRYFLLVSVIFSLLLPFLKLRVYNPQPVLLSEITVTPFRNLVELVTVYGQDFSGTVQETISSSRIAILIYLAGILFFLGRFILRLVQIYILIHKNQVTKSGSVKFVSVDKNFSPFSFMSYVFINPEKKNVKGYDKMVAHEMEHIKQGHTFDVLILELMTVFQWINPFMWILKRAIRENHEFLADRAILNSGVSPSNYKQLLLNNVVGFQMEMTNNFNSSLIKNRIKMISKIKSSKFANYKYLIGFLTGILLIIAFACEQKESLMPPSDQDLQTIKIYFEGDKAKVEAGSADLDRLKELFSGSSGIELVTDSLGNVFLEKSKIKGVIMKKGEMAAPSKTTSNGEPIFYIVETMPEFPGGDNALMQFIVNKVEYPVVAQQNGIQGKVYVSFIVSKDGSVTDAKVVRGVDPLLDKEALRVVSSLPKWKPGEQRGQKVNVSYTVPINFALQ